MDWCLARPREEAGIAFMHKIVFVSLCRPDLLALLSIASCTASSTCREAVRGDALVHLCANMVGEREREREGERERVEEKRNDLVLNFNNTFSWVLQSTSNQGLNWICNVCLVTHKSLSHQTDSLRASKQMSVCEPCLGTWQAGIVCITANTGEEVFKF